ncbi:hypothetical protein Plhal304r1_c015g0056361 [Plasmopara halstedii]
MAVPRYPGGLAPFLRRHYVGAEVSPVNRSGLWKQLVELPPYGLSLVPS